MCIQTQGNSFILSTVNVCENTLQVDEFNICDLDLFVFGMERVLVISHFKCSHESSDDQNMTGQHDKNDNNNKRKKCTEIRSNEDIVYREYEERKRRIFFNIL